MYFLLQVRQKSTNLQILPSFHNGLLLFVRNLNHIFTKYFLRAAGIQLRCFRFGDEVMRRNPAMFLRMLWFLTQPHFGAFSIQDFDNFILFDIKSLTLSRRVLCESHVEWMRLCVTEWHRLSIIMGNN